MNLLTLKRFKNELIVLGAFLFLLMAFWYKVSAESGVKEEQQVMAQQMHEISKVTELKKLWNSKTLAKDVASFKTIVAAAKIKSFEKRSKKMVASYENLTVQELNRITKRLFKTPVQLVKLAIHESAKEKYTMEFTCKW